MILDISNQDYCFSYSQDDLKELALYILRYSKSLGSTETYTNISEMNGLFVSVRNKSPETIQYNINKTLIIIIYIRKKCGSASTSDLSLNAIKDTIEAAYNIAKFTQEDDYAGLADKYLLEMNPNDLDLYHKWNLTVNEAIAILKKVENAAYSVSEYIKNTAGSNISCQHSQFILATSNGFLNGYLHSQHYISCSPIAANKNNLMQCDNWYSLNRSMNDLENPENIGRYAAQRAISRIDSRTLSTRKCPVLFEAPVAIELLNIFIKAATGSAIYRKMSFLLNSIGKLIFSSHIQITENPHIKRAIGSAPFDNDGVRTNYRILVENGILKEYFLSSYSARKLDMQSTGNAGGSYNIFLESYNTKATDNFEFMLKTLNRGLLITGLMGQGINYITGDYSRAAFGFWVENGYIEYPVDCITIASNLQYMFSNIISIGADKVIKNAKSTGSVLINEMTVAGK